MPVDFLLHEFSSGYSIFKVIIHASTTGCRLEEVQQEMAELDKFGKMVELIGFTSFQKAPQEPKNANDISKGICSVLLKTILEANLLYAGMKSQRKMILGVADKNLGGSIKAFLPNFKYETGDTNEVVGALLDGLRQHAPKLLEWLREVSFSYYEKISMLTIQQG